MCDCPASTTRPDLPSHWQYPTRCGVSETNRLEALGQCIPPSSETGIRINVDKNTISATIPVAPAGPEGGITASDDSVWMVTDKDGTLSRIDPSTNSVRQKIPVPPGSYNPIFSNGIVWITGVDRKSTRLNSSHSGTS